MMYASRFRTSFDSPTKHPPFACQRMGRRGGPKERAAGLKISPEVAFDSEEEETQLVAALAASLTFEPDPEPWGEPRDDSSALGAVGAARSSASADGEAAEAAQRAPVVTGWAYAVWDVSGAPELTGVHTGSASAWRYLVERLPGKQCNAKTCALRRYESLAEAIVGYQARAPGSGVATEPRLFHH